MDYDQMLKACVLKNHGKLKKTPAMQTIIFPDFYKAPINFLGIFSMWQYPYCLCFYIQQNASFK